MRPCSHLPFNVSGFVVAVAAAVIGLTSSSARAGALWALGGNDLLEPHETVFEVDEPQLIGFGVQSVSCGDGHAVVLKTDGSLWTMGRNNSGQLGDGTQTNRHEPRQLATNVVYAAASYEQTFFVRTDGSLWAVGRNDYGQLGTGDTQSRAQPVQVATAVVAVTPGRAHTLFRKTDRTLWAVGNNDAGQLGDGTWTRRLLPVQVAENVVGSSGGFSHSVFLKQDGSAWAMGSNDNKQYRAGAGSITPVAIAADVRAIAAATDTTQILKHDGALWVIGANNHPQITPDPWPSDWHGIFQEIGTIPSVRPFPDFTLLASNVSAFSLNNTACAYVTTDGRGWRRKINAATDSLTSPTLTDPVALGVDFAAITLGFNCTFLLGNDHSLRVTGSTGWGGIGIDSGRDWRNEARLLAREVVGGATAGDSVFFVRSDRTLFALGDNRDGALGLGRGESRVTVPAPLATEVTSVATNGACTVFVRSDHSLWGFGDNSTNALTADPVATIPEPRRLRDGVRSATVGAGCVFFINTDDTLWGVGSNTGGQLGDGSTNARPNPVLIATDVAEVVSKSATYFRRKDGTLWVCGDDGFGRLAGNPVVPGKPSPIPVQVASDVATMTTNGVTLLFTKTDGTLWAAGSNRYGQMGFNDTTYRPTPVQIGERIRAVALGETWGLFLGADASLWAAGENYADLLYPSAPPPASVPALIARNVEAIVCDGNHPLFIQSQSAVSAPRFSVAPPSGKLGLGESLVLRATVEDAAGPQTLQWYRNGERLAGETSATLRRFGVGPADAGEYELVATNSAGETRSTKARVSVVRALPPPVAGGKLTGLSARVLLRTNVAPIVAGVGIAGGPVRLLVRAAGPALRDFGVADALAQPELQALRGQTVFAENAGWQSSPDAAALPGVFAELGEFAFAFGSADCALLLTLDPGAYTFHVTSRNGLSGVALIEAYAVRSAGLTGRLTALSCRAYTGSGTAVLTAGFAVEGPTQVLLRGLGPRLASYGVGGALTAPALTLFDGTTAADRVTDWGSFYPFAETSALFARVGLGALPADSHDAVCIATVDGGVRSVQIAGTAGESGEALAEVYLVQP